MLDKDAFFEEYKVYKEFESSGLQWETLEEIYDDYCGSEEICAVAENLERYLRDNIRVPMHSVRCRTKEPRHLIEKIIRKRGKSQSRKYLGICRNNYKEIVRDLIGIRILVLAKEDWRGIFEELVRLFPEEQGGDRFMAEPPVAYTRYGDRDIFQDLLQAEHSNKGYRSQHYIVSYKGCYCEIQVRTLAEEVYGEFDHKVKYPYRDHNKFLIRYTKTLSQLLGSVDELLSTCFQMKEEGWEECSRYYEEDQYIDWHNISQKTKEHRIEAQISAEMETDEKISADAYARNFMLRRERSHGKRQAE